MKTLLTILFVAASIFAKPQGPVQIYMIQPAYVCLGDSINVFFKWNGSLGNHNFRMGCPTMYMIWARPMASFTGLPKFLVGADTIYMIRLNIIPSWPIGLATVSADLITPTPIYITCDTEVGIKEYDRADIAEYFDLYGIPTAPSPGRVLIKKQGHKISKTIIVSD